MSDNTWISVKDRLPEVKDDDYAICNAKCVDVLCTFKHGQFTMVDILSFSTGVDRICGDDGPSVGFIEYISDGDYWYYERADVLAWMYIPKPYEEEIE